MTRAKVGLIALALVCWSFPATAQSAPTENGLAELSSEQKQLIYQSVDAMHKNNAAPPGFRAAVGATVPTGIELQPVPSAVADVVPEVKATDVAMIEKQVVVVDPKSRKVLAVVTHAE
jgi:hypothetical protein